MRGSLASFVCYINQVEVLEYPWCSGGVGSWGCGPSFGVGSVNVGLVSHLGTNLDFAYGAILKGLVAWGGGNSGGALLGGVLWLGGWLVVAFLYLLLLPDIWCLIFWLKLASLFCL